MKRFLATCTGSLLLLTFMVGNTQAMGLRRDYKRADHVRDRLQELRDMTPEERDIFIEEHGNIERLRERVQNFVVKTVNRLEKVQWRIENNPYLDQEDKTRISGEIQEDIDWFNDHIPLIDTATGRELVDAFIDIVEYYNNHKDQAKRALGLHIKARIWHAIEKAEHVLDRLTAKVEELDAEGVDTTDLWIGIDDFEANIAIAREKAELAEEKFQEAQAAEEVHDLLVAGKEFVHEAREYLHEAKQALHELINTWRAEHSSTDS